VFEVGELILQNRLQDVFRDLRSSSRGHAVSAVMDEGVLYLR